MGPELSNLLQILKVSFVYPAIRQFLYLNKLILLKSSKHAVPEMVGYQDGDAG